MPTYATVDDVAEWMGLTEAPAGTGRALVAAARLLGTLPQIRWATEDDGRSAAASDALRDASCAQVEYWHTLQSGNLDMSFDIIRPKGPIEVGSARMPEMCRVGPRTRQALQPIWCAGPRVFRRWGWR